MYDRIASPTGGPKYAGGCSHHMAATFILLRELPLHGNLPPSKRHLLIPPFLSRSLV